MYESAHTREVETLSNTRFVNLSNYFQRSLYRNPSRRFPALQSSFSPSSSSTPVITADFPSPFSTSSPSVSHRTLNPQSRKNDTVHTIFFWRIHIRTGRVFYFFIIIFFSAATSTLKNKNVVEHKQFYIYSTLVNLVLR